MTVYQLTLITAALFIHCYAEILFEPMSQVSFEGQVSVFSCRSNETLFWLINGEFYDFSQTSHKNKGLEFTDHFTDSGIARSLSIMATVETNNTVVNCLSLNSDNIVNTSRNATLTVIGSPLNVQLDLVDNHSFTFSWESPSTPIDYSTHNYTVTILYNPNSSQTHTKTFTIQANNETTVFNYPLPDDVLPLGSCAQFLFSVVSRNKIGESQPVRKSWEIPLQNIGALENTKCSLKYTEDDAITALVIFTFPNICHFQSVSYSFSLSLAGTDSVPIATSPVHTHRGGESRDVQGQLTDLKLSNGYFYKMEVNAEFLNSGEMIHRRPIICTNTQNLKPPDIGGLNTPEGDQSPTEIIVGIVISALLLLTILLMNTVLIVIAFKKGRQIK